MEKNMETTALYQGMYRGLYRGYTGTTEKNMEAAI